MLGILEQYYGNNAYYVHLVRDRRQTAQSFLRRYDQGIMRAYSMDIIGAGATYSPLDVCLDYVDTVNANIVSFLRDKDKKVTVELENVTNDFSHFWEWIGARGDLSTALSEWKILYNKSETNELRYANRDKAAKSPLARVLPRGIVRVWKLISLK